MDESTTRRSAALLAVLVVVSMVGGATLVAAAVILKDIAEALDPIIERGVTVLLTEQSVTFAMEHADRIYLLENGEAVREGTPHELRGDDHIRESYLGG